MLIVHPNFKLTVLILLSFSFISLLDFIYFNAFMKVFTMLNALQNTRHLAKYFNKPLNYQDKPITPEL